MGKNVTILTDQHLVIDLTKAVTRKEYLRIKDKQGKPCSAARLSQLIAKGHLTLRRYPDLNNLELIVLPESLQQDQENEFKLKQPVHTYSGKELANFFITFLVENQQKFQACEDRLQACETIVIELSTQNEHLQTQLQVKEEFIQQLVHNYQLVEQAQQTDKQREYEMDLERRKWEEERTGLELTIQLLESRLDELRAMLLAFSPALVNS
ncbi:hypothetical protein [Spirosoma gilvum]